MGRHGLVLDSHEVIKKNAETECGLQILKYVLSALYRKSWPTTALALSFFLQTLNCSFP